MSDSIKKWHEMQEDKQEDKKLKIYESPDKGETITERPFGGSISDRVTIKSKRLLSNGDKKLAYSILVEYPEAAILEAARILKNGE
jgi:hypothetical protein